ncbi:MAG: hypothetical protein ACT6Q5_12930 [Sphingopyxis solisilvae]|uniref:hypothetical protein n=1 Tax=Sphingopyxis solisilvae TaxID=1886788 RepID=UPI004036AB58
MRFSSIAAALIAATAAPAAATGVGTPQSLLAIEDEAARSPARLAPLAADSVWTPRFAAAADELLRALWSRDEARWRPLMGGDWLAEADRASVESLLRDRRSPFLHALFSKGRTRSVLLGWQAGQAPSATDIAAIEAGQEAEALVCWSATGGDDIWPTTAKDADNAVGRPYACARIAYSIRGEAPTWRAFIEQAPGGSAREPA